ncbi:MAG: tetratricopeptide repeat protein [Halopseudomonas sabulinigri]
MLKNTLLISIVLLLMGCTEEPELERRSGLDDDLDYLTSSQLVEKYGEVPAEQLIRYRSMFSEQDHADKNYILYRADAIKIYDAETAFRDGMDYQFGNGKDQSYLRAKELYESAAELGSVKALFFLGIMYNFGYGVPPNIITAREYYEKAANQNDMKSAYFMALSYEFRRDTNQAQYWYDRVTKVPYPLGDIIKDYDANSRFVSEAARDFSNGIDLYGEAANYGVEEAQFALSLLLNSHGEMQDYFSAKRWLDKLLEKGFPIAQFEVARMYLRKV